MGRGCWQGQRVPGRSRGARESQGVLGMGRGCRGWAGSTGKGRDAGKGRGVPGMGRGYWEGQGVLGKVKGCWGWAGGASRSGPTVPHTACSPRLPRGPGSAAPRPPSSPPGLAAHLHLPGHIRGASRPPPPEWGWAPGAPPAAQCWSCNRSRAVTQFPRARWPLSGHCGRWGHGRRGRGSGSSGSGGG